MNKLLLSAWVCVAFTSLCAAQSSTKPDETQQQDSPVPAAIPPAPETYMGRTIATHLRSGIGLVRWPQGK